MAAQLMVECARCHRVRYESRMEYLWYRNVGAYQDKYRQSGVAVCSARTTCKDARKEYRKSLSQ